MTEDKPNIVTDEDWKEQVKAQDRALDEELRKERQAEAATDETPDVDTTEPQATTEQPQSESPPDEPEIDASQLPPANINAIIGMFSTQAMVSLGVLPSPDGKMTKQLPLAKHFIDMLGVIEDKTKGNLTDDEQKFLDQTLHHLRMTFVEVKKQA